MCRHAPAVRRSGHRTGRELGCGARLVSDASADYSQMSEAELEGHIASNAESLKLLRLGLSRACRVPV